MSSITCLIQVETVNDFIDLCSVQYTTLYEAAHMVQDLGCGCLLGKSDIKSGPSCSKLTTSLVNDSLKFTSSDTQIC